MVLLGAGSCCLSWLRRAAKCFLPGSNGLSLSLSLFLWLPSIAFQQRSLKEGLPGSGSLLASPLRSMELPALRFALDGERGEGETGV